MIVDTRNSAFLIRLPDTVSNGLNAQQLDIFANMLLKDSLSMRYLFRNVM